MMENMYRYPVFFDCHSLLEEQKKKIQYYFCIHRKSGGGECGPLRRVNDKVYSIAFRHQKDQQRVLQQSKHVVEIGHGSLTIAIRGSVEPHASSTVTITTSTSTPSQDFTAPEQSLQSVHDSTNPPSGEEYVLQPDTYLFWYLNENPRAWNKLEKELSAVACSAQIYLEEGKVLVRRSAQPGAADENKNWKLKVDRLFNGYLYETDSQKVRPLLRCFGSQPTDEMKAYSEAGMAVGEHSQVSTRLKAVEDLTVKHQGSCVRVKQTSICQLGEAKLHFLWKEVKRSWGEDFPGVNVSRGDAGQLVLEGYVKEILVALAWISDKEKLVLKRTVSDMSPHFLAYLRKAYGGPGVLAEVLRMGEEVTIELRDTELCLFSLSADKLDEAEKILRGEFKEIKMDVPNGSVVPSELQEKLKSRTNEMNKGKCRAQVVFMSDSTVYILGHTKEVEELSETVTQFISDQSTVQTTFHLPSPLLAETLAEFLQLHNFDNSDVFHSVSSSSKPMVVLEGSSSNAAEVRNRQGLFLDSVLQDGITTNPVESLEYLQILSGKDKVPGVGKCPSQNQCHRATQNQASLGVSEENSIVASYSLCDMLQVLVCQGDITKLDADALVNAANEDLDHCGGVAAALSKAGGPAVQEESNALVKQTGKIPIGDAVVTTGGNLKCKRLLHAVGPVGGTVGGKERFLLERAVRSALDLAEMLELKSIAMPCISSGAFHVPVSVCSEAIVTAVKEFGSQGGRSLSKIILIDNRGEVVKAMHGACDRLLQTIGDINRTQSDAEKDTARGATAGTAPEDVNVEITENQQAFMSVQEMLQHSGVTKDSHKPDHVSAAKRIILLGKSGAGKSSLANTIFGEELFKPNHSPNSGTKACQVETRLVNDRSITLIDTPGLFDAERSEEEMRPEIMRCITECAPGPHAFLIVLKVEKFTEQEKTVIAKICEYFSEDALKYAVIVFTYGEQLCKEVKIKEFVRQNKSLSELVEKCGGRCHVFDNTYWKNNQQNNYRSNQVQVEDLLNTIDKMVVENNGGYYTNDLLQAVEDEIKEEEEHIKQTSGNMQLAEIREQAKATVSNRFLIQLTGTATGVMLGAFYGVEVMVKLVIAAVKNNTKLMNYWKSVPPTVREATKDIVVTVGNTGAAGVAAGAAAAVAAVAAAGVIGGAIGHNAAEGAETVQHAREKATTAVMAKRNDALSHINNVFYNSETTKP